MLVGLPMEVALMLVELAEEIGDLSAGEVDALADARARIELAATAATPHPER